MLRALARRCLDELEPTRELELEECGELLLELQPIGDRGRCERPFDELKAEFGVARLEAAASAAVGTKTPKPWAC